MKDKQKYLRRDSRVNTCKKTWRVRVVKRRRLNLKKVNKKKRSNTEKQNVKLVAAAEKIIAPVALETRRRKKSRKNAKQKKKYLKIYISKKSK